MSLELHEIAEADHRILNPFTDDKLMTLAAAAHVHAGTRILDLACGKGEMLCRWAETIGVTGHGVDISEVFLAAARDRAEELGVADRVSFEQGDAGAYSAEPSSYDVVSCLGATWIGGGLAGTLDLMRPPVHAGGLLLVGEPYWTEPAPEAAYEALGVGAEEFTSLAGTADRFAAAGLELVEMVLADGDSWDRYVAAQWWTLDDWLRVHPDDPRRDDVRAFLHRWRRVHLDYGRRYFGWGVFVLRATG
ncbi:MAG: class I SAM-dependent methyltransferase [Geodermatophilaceae bacterium]|jgi:SAM-dependent methyltransferase|nr:class I SAM-dependent methyltransferase [Geodermatophilaceae bacterium]